MDIIGSVYALKNPINGDIFYVGKTIKDLPRRLAQHISDSSFLCSSKDKLIYSIIEDLKSPEIVLLESVSFDPSETFDTRFSDCEKKWIKTISDSYKITNIIGNTKRRSQKNTQLSKLALETLISEVPKPVYEIEKDLNMPTTTLQKALKGSRGFPKKWLPILRLYVETKQYLLSGAIPHISSSKREVVEQVVKDFTKPTNQIKPQEQPKSNFTIDTRPKTLDQLKALCPPELKGFDRSEWIGKKRQEYGI